MCLSMQPSMSLFGVMRRRIEQSSDDYYYQNGTAPQKESLILVGLLLHRSHVTTSVLQGSHIMLAGTPCEDLAMNFWQLFLSRIGDLSRDATTSIPCKQNTSSTKQQSKTTLQETRFSWVYDLKSTGINKLSLFFCCKPSVKSKSRPTAAAL